MRNLMMICFKSGLKEGEAAIGPIKGTKLLPDGKTL